MEFDAKKLIEESISNVISEYGVSKSEEAIDAGKKVKEAIKQETTQDLESHKDATLLTKGIRKAKELGDTPLTGKHAAVIATAIAAGLGGVALAKRLRGAKKAAKAKA